MSKNNGNATETDNETDDSLDWQDGWHWTTEAMHGNPPGGRP